MKIIKEKSTSKWGFVRETKENAAKAGLDEDTGLHRTGLEDYLRVIFPEIQEQEWIHDKTIKGSGRRIRPDYRCESIKMIIEFDGVQHYKLPDKILKDVEHQNFYEQLGYKVVRIPYFIQLTNDVVREMFGREVSEDLFNPNIGTMGAHGRNSPAYCCYEGLKRMVAEFKKYPQQYEVNLKLLKEADDEFLTGASLLEKMYIAADN
jgi:hypothetical protein